MYIRGKEDKTKILIITMLTILALCFSMLTPQPTLAVTKLGQVKNLKAVSTSTSSIKLSWKKVKKAKGYQIYRATSKNGVYKKVKTIKKAKTTKWTNPGLKESTTYWYKVRAYKGSKKGKFSAKKSAKTKENPVNPGKPIQLDRYNIFINYQGNKITMGQIWDDDLQNSMGTADRIVQRDYHTAYVYADDLSNYLEVYIGKETGETIGQSGRVIGWLTNQPEIANWEGTQVQSGTKKANYNNLASIRDEAMGGGDWETYINTPMLQLYNKYVEVKHPNPNGPSTFNADSGDVLWGGVCYDAAFLGGQAGKNQGDGINPTDEEVMAEYYINMIRKSYDISVLPHSAGMYSGNGGAKDSANDWAKHGDIRYNGQPHMTSGSVKPELTGKNFGQRISLVEADTGSIGYGENASGLVEGALARHHIEQFYYSQAHRNTMLDGTAITKALAIGITGNQTKKYSACAMWIGFN